MTPPAPLENRDQLVPNPSDHAQGKVDGEDLGPEPGRVVPALVACFQGERLHQEDEKSESKR
jgi:hypothetical protein